MIFEVFHSFFISLKILAKFDGGIDFCLCYLSIPVQLEPLLSLNREFYFQYNFAVISG